MTTENQAYWIITYCRPAAHLSNKPRRWLPDMVGPFSSYRSAEQSAKTMVRNPRRANIEIEGPFYKTMPGRPAPARRPVRFA